MKQHKLHKNEIINILKSAFYQFFAVFLWLVFFTILAYIVIKYLNIVLIVCLIFILVSCSDKFRDWFYNTYVKIDRYFRK